VLQRAKVAVVEVQAARLGLGRYHLMLRRRRYRSHIASPFMARVIKTRTNPAAAALAWNAASGREVQLNIWIGITVNGDVSHSNERYGGSLVTGAGGRKAMKVSAPIVMIGAVSPIARAMPMM